MASESITVETTEKKSSSWSWLDSAIEGAKSIANGLADISSSGVDVAKNYKTAVDTLNGKTVYTVERASTSMSIVPIIGVIGAIVLASTIF